MPIHLHDRDVVPELDGVRSALIVPCNLCPGVTVAVRKNRPFLRLARSLLSSAPFEEHLATLQARLGEAGVTAEVFRSYLPHHWFMCMWTSGRRERLKKEVRKYDAVIVLGCDSATETVRDVVRGTDCRVIEGMRVAGIMNAKLRFRFPDRVGFEECLVFPIAHTREEEVVGR